MSGPHRQGAPVLIWPVARPTDKSAMKLSSVSPDLWLAMTPQPASLAIFTAMMDSVTVPIWFTYIQTVSAGQCPLECVPTEYLALSWDCCQQSMPRLLACQMTFFHTAHTDEIRAVAVWSAPLWGVTEYLEQEGIASLLLNGGLDACGVGHQQVITDHLQCQALISAPCCSLSTTMQLLRRENAGRQAVCLS